MTDWKYKGVCDNARLRALETSAPFEDIARRLERDMEIVCCHTRDCCDKPGYKRTIYCVEVALQLFDVIFNSQSGYRGAYFQSPERGLSANGLVLSTVTPRLVAWTRDRCIHQGPAFAEKSLSAASANYGSRKSHFHSVIGARANGPLQCEHMWRIVDKQTACPSTAPRSSCIRSSQNSFLIVTQMWRP